MIRRNRNTDNGINTYYNIDSNQEFMIYSGSGIAILA